VKDCVKDSVKGSSAKKLSKSTSVKGVKGVKDFLGRAQARVYACTRARTIARVWQNLIYPLTPFTPLTALRLLRDFRVKDSVKGVKGCE
jgi:hypothetical protein